MPHWSSGVQRIIGLAYLLVWTWQRRVVKALMEVVDNLNQHTAANSWLRSEAFDQGDTVGSHDSGTASA